MDIQLPNNWHPRPYQIGLWRYLEHGGKRAVCIWHRRAGKDDVALHWTATAAMQRVATYWHMLPEASQARKAIWDAINPHTGIRRIDEAFPKEIRQTTREQEMMIRFVNGSTWQVVGSDNYGSLVGSPPAGLVYSEWALADPSSWAYLRPILAENGGWVVFITTPRGDNHGRTLYEFGVKEPTWYAELLPGDKTGVFEPEQLEAEKREYVAQFGQSRGEAMFNQEFLCSFTAAFSGKAVYPTFDRAAHVASEPLLPVVEKAIENGNPTVIRGWDHTGLHPACVLTYLLNNTWLIFKEFWEEDAGIEDFADIVKIWCAQNLPPDTTYKDIGDPAGNRTRDARKKTAADYVREHCGIHISEGIQTFKIRVECVTNRLNRRDGILIDPTECNILIDGFLGGYGYKEIGKSGVFKDTISGSDKDKYCDVHDALQYPATKIFGPSMRVSFENKPKPVTSWAAL
jgi:hypothetical protein